MFSKIHKIYLFLIIGLLVCLVLLQIVWQKQAYDKQQKEFQVKVLMALNNVRGKLRNENSCVNFYSKAAVNEHEALILLKQTWNETGLSGQPDTIAFYLDIEESRRKAANVPLAIKAYKSSIPTFAEINMQIQYNEKNQAPIYTIDSNYRENVFSINKIENILDTFTVLRLLQEALNAEQITIPFGYAFTHQTDHIIDFSYNFDAKQNTPLYTIDVFKNDNFIAPHLLSIQFHDFKTWIGQGSMAYISLCIIVLIIFLAYHLFDYFKKQTELSILKSNFIHNLNHEMNTPIANILLALESSQKHIFPEQSKLFKLHEIMTKEAQRLQYNIDRSLQIGIIETDQIPIDWEWIDIKPFLFSIIELFKPAIEKINGEIKTDVDESERVKMDAALMTSAISNLIDNAIKYRRVNSKLIISIKAFTLNEKFVLEVHDNGIGMNEKVITHIFEKFYRAESKLIHNTKGFGLGLNYTKAIVESHGGQITVHSTEGKGSTFIISLPILN